MADLLKIAQEYVDWDPNEKTRSEISLLLSQNNTDELQKRFFPRIAFGTAGLRGAMKAGYAYMNDLTVIQAAQGLCAYLQKNVKDISKMGVCVGYDARHNSKRYAEWTAAVFLTQKIKVYLFSEFVPTPFVAYGTPNLGCAAGVMVTASHNPKDDNGYKVYWGNGCQIISPVDKGIYNSINENLKPWEALSLDILNNNNELLVDPLKQINERYFQDIQKWCFMKSENASASLKIGYTAMHGVGARFSAQSFSSFGLKPFFTTPLQNDPDPEFPTVAFPNPEEGKGALVTNLSF
eukprot:TRINITY_DN29_c1_g1_i1.p1 TRINITY_DN29_c1_g1~~TRINITY_DN29_c1_g1_i1.p1  ORF type:complete len:293 (+),score=85.01 TRINITY_DN29_c1_g1_i1:43-921(+)